MDTELLIIGGERRPATTGRTFTVFAPGTGESLAEVAEVFEYWGGAANKIMGEPVPIQGSGLDLTLREPVGVCALITPWNSSGDRLLEDRASAGLWEHPLSLGPGSERGIGTWGGGTATPPRKVPGICIDKYRSPCTGARCFIPWG